MNTKNIAFFSLLSVLSIASSASAATGALDGTYHLNYQSMQMGVQCGMAAADGTYDVDYATYALDLTEEESLPEGAFDVFMETRIAAIEAQNLPYYKEQAAIRAVEVFFMGLEDSVNGMLTAYPETMTVSLAEGYTAPSSWTYTFKGDMTDATSGEQRSSLGTMGIVTGQYRLNPVYYYDSQTLNGVPFYVSWGSQLAGNLAAETGNLSWAGEAMMTDPATGDVYGCGLSNIALYQVSGDVEVEARSTSKAVPAAQLSTMKQQVHSMTTRKAGLNAQQSRQAQTLKTAFVR